MSIHEMNDEVLIAEIVKTQQYLNELRDERDERTDLRETACGGPCKHEEDFDDGNLMPEPELPE
jgi:hypothetical protein